MTQPPEGAGEGKGSRKKWAEVCGLLSETITLITLAIFSYPFYDLTKHSILNLRPDP